MSVNPKRPFLGVTYQMSFEMCWHLLIKGLGTENVKTFFSLLLNIDWDPENTWAKSSRINICVKQLLPDCCLHWSTGEIVSVWLWTLGRESLWANSFLWWKKKKKTNKKEKSLLPVSCPYRCLILGAVSPFPKGIFVIEVGAMKYLCLLSLLSKGKIKVMLQVSPVLWIFLPHAKPSGWASNLTHFSFWKGEFQVQS